MIKAKHVKTPFKEGVSIDIKGDDETLLKEFDSICLSLLREGFTEEELKDEIELAVEIKKLCEGK